ncbi:MAG: hypothetical protein NTV09_02190 [Bacteroidetes bacterium]|nr:hypothetical protein [Bacteroidota bacterium]
MKKSEIPQDKSLLEGFTREVDYAVDESGKYTSVLSSGWEVKTSALDLAWDDIKLRVKEAEEKVRSGQASPVLFFMELRLMDPGILAAYTGYWQWQVKRHMKANVFNKLSDKKLQKYADLFEIKLEELKNPFAK